MNNFEIKIDYLSATFPMDIDANDSEILTVHETVRLFSEYLNVKSSEVMKCTYAQNNYHYQYMLGEFMILRLYGPINDNYQHTCHLEFKGDGCRDFEVRNPDKKWNDLLMFLLQLNARIKRIDIAIDDFDGSNVDLPYLYDKVVKKGHYTSKFRTPPTPYGTFESGMSIQFGSHSSPLQLVIYDKLKERNKRNKSCDKDYWVRYEMRFKAPYTNEIVLALIKEDEPDLQKLAFARLYALLDIKEDNNFAKASQYEIATDQKWKDFLNNVEKGELAKPEEFKNDSMDKYLEFANSYVTTFLTYLYISVGKDPYLFEMEIYKFLSEKSSFSKNRIHKLNIYLEKTHMKPLDNIELNKLKEEWKDILLDKELPF